MALYLFQGNHSPVKDWESFCPYENNHHFKDGRLLCSCGENYGNFKWHWESENSTTHVLSKEDREVLFHPVYSSGTAAIRGKDILKPNLHHYWEIKILTKLYGTDVMIGVGTSKVLLNGRQYKFCSMLGSDNQSWGYSYHGVIQHDRLLRKYGGVFGLGTIVGVHLDMTTGTLEYYLNRRPLGIAFRGLKEKDLYPMICSTAAQSATRLTCALTLEPTLQMKCLSIIRKHPKLIKLFYSIPGLSKLIRKEYFWLVPPKPSENDYKDTLTLEDRCVLPLETLLDLHSSKHRKRMRTNKWGLYDQYADPDHISYREKRTSISPSSSSLSLDDNKERVESLIKDMEDNFQEAFRNLSSRIETRHDRPDMSPSSSIIYKNMDDIGDTLDDDDDAETDNRHLVRCRVHDYRDVQD